MPTARSRRTTLALLLALLAAVGMGLAATGVSRLADGAPLAGVALLVLGVAFVASAFRWLHSINERHTGPPDER